MPGRFDQPFRAYRHAGGGQVVRLAEDGATFRGDGQPADAVGRVDVEDD